MTDTIKTLQREITDLDYCYGRAQKNKDYSSMEWINKKRKGRRDAIKTLETRIKINNNRK